VPEGPPGRQTNVWWTSGGEWRILS